jgi:hypothetical protein
MWLKRILIGLGIVAALVIAIVLVVGYWAPSGEVSKTMSVDVGDHTVTIGGKYKNVTQESMADGMDIKVDGHEIAINADQLTVDGKIQVLEAARTSRSRSTTKAHSASSSCSRTLEAPAKPRNSRRA